jgi:hypothetical protein
VGMVSRLCLESGLIIKRHKYSNHIPGNVTASMVLSPGIMTFKMCNILLMPYGWPDISSKETEV